MAGFRGLEGPEIGSPPMLSEWPTACSRNTGMFCRMKRPKRSRESVCRCRDHVSRVREASSLSNWFSDPKDQAKLNSMARWMSAVGGAPRRRGSLERDDFRLVHSGGPIPWRDGVPITSRERRCLELYQKHDAAWRVMVAKAVARRRGDS
jgi:hypothetical protein